MKVNVKIKKSVFNDVYLPLLHDDNRYLILYGGAGSGKSVFAAQKIIYRLLNEEKHKFLVVRKVARTMRNSVFALFRDVISTWGLSKIFKITESNMEIRCANGNSIIFVGIDDPEKMKSIHGITGIWIEEASEFEQEDVQQLDLRLRGRTKNYKQMIVSFNPISSFHWLKKVYFDSPKENATVKHTTYLDNKFIDPDYRKVLEDLKDQDYTYYTIYALGKWGTLGNIIFKNWEVQDLSEIRQTFDRFNNGLDFGFSDDPNALVHMHYDNKRKTLYILDELYMTELTNDLLAEEVKKIIDRQVVTCDSSEPKSIKELCQFGVRAIPAKKGPDSVNFGIDWLKRQKIIIDVRCVNAKREFERYRWKEDKYGNVLRVPVDKDNHLIDAIRYGCEDLMTPNTIKANDGFKRHRIKI
ncbi:PBSX family phage terminase large subunit [Aneurinibacillus aneurinilyticus]|uniref:PBSX family phage terminase large subunit n=1 Tax=Aneurinibacillus aneurinilyticus TaxID=1391 RepID=UPI00366A9BF0